ncbi:MAG: AAA family ATPase [Desulfobacula sp.]|nr:AAA family ATPase [Desulfobacula sp.]
MVNIWLIRPGEGGRLWEECKENNCIVIGWEDEDGFSKYKSLDDVKKDYDSNDANSIWYFYNDIKIGDVVIAIKGNDIVLGIGKVDSGYIGPKDPKNPGLDYKNARMIKWLITETLENISYTFPSKTVTPNKAERWEEIKMKYIQKDLKYKETFDDLLQRKNIDLSDFVKRFLQEINSDDLKEHRKEHNRRSKNVQDKLRKENVAALTEDKMFNILNDTNAAEGYYYFDLRDTFNKNNGIEKFKEKLINHLDTVDVNESDIKHFCDSIDQMGLGYLSELLCLKHPNKFYICNKITNNFLKRINVNIKEGLPRGKKGNVGSRYIAAHPHFQKILDMLKDGGLEDATFLDVDMFVWWMKDNYQAIPEEFSNVKIQILKETFSHTRNVILYGPPGTGKTFIAQQFVKDYLKDQIYLPKTLKEIKIDLIRDLKWYQVIALTIYLKGKDQKVKVPELKNEELIKDYFEIVKGRTKNLGQTLWAQMGSHSTPYSKLVNYENRIQPALFDKTPESEWYLIPEGIEYIENSYEDALVILSGGKKPDYETNIKQYYKFVTFHQSYGYEDFLEGLKPKTDDNGAISYEIEPGVFIDICDKAKNDSANEYLLIIDEINRGNIAKIFGELITLIEDDKRQGAKNEMTVTLPYSKEDFTVPLNLFILGTMNTADRSIALLDIALRRRFTFLEIMPDYSIIDCEIEGLNIGDLLKELNYMVASLIDRDHQIGHSYFCGIVKTIKNEELESAKTELQFVWYRKIIPLLQEYFYNDWEQLKLVLGDFVSENNTSNNNLKLQDRMVNKNYSITEFKDWDRFLNALSQIVSNEAKTETQVDSTESESVEGENES